MDRDQLDAITIDPVIPEPKLEDPLMTSVKIGRSDVTKQSPASSGNAAGYITDSGAAFENKEPTKSDDIPASGSDAERGSVDQRTSRDRCCQSRDPVEAFLSRSRKRYAAGVFAVQRRVHGALIRQKSRIKHAFWVCILIGYAMYFCFAVYYSPKGAMVVVILTSLALLIVAHKVVMARFGDSINRKCLRPISGILASRQCRYFRWVLYLAILVGVIVFLAMDVFLDVRRAMSFFGILTFVFFAYITSKNPSKVKWRPVLWGLGLQFLLGIAILRWSLGYIFFRFLGDQVEAFLNFSDEGSKFVFGDEGYLLHRMAFKVFPSVIYFSAVISIFYYWGVMQYVIVKIAWLMQFTMATTAIESMNAATNIFIGMAESVVMLRPFVPKLTKSELHAVMTGGFATVSGSYVAALVEVGATPEHLLSAAIMSAPAALAMAKLSYPETAVSLTKTEDDVYMDKTPARNVIEAASTGAIAAIKVVASVAANLIAILGLVAFLDAALSYLGSRVGYPELSFQKICAVVFWPVAAIMGVEIEDCGKIAGLIGTKVFVDEFISFKDLGDMVRKGEVQERSAVIATYACCGFGSISAVGIYIGALVSIAPQRRGDISEVAFRAVINGNMAGFLTACIAGVLYTGTSLMNVSEGAGFNHTLLSNVTTIATTYATSGSALRLTSRIP